MYGCVDNESERQLNKFSACVIFRRDSQLIKVIMSRLLNVVEDDQYKGRDCREQRAIPFQRLDVLNTSLKGMPKRGGGRCGGRSLRQSVSIP
jgi:hypothetical protein